MCEQSNNAVTQLVATLRQHLPALLKESPVFLAYLYGSAAEGLTTPLSDVDIGLVIAPDQDMSPYERLIFETDIALELGHRCKLYNTDIRIVNDAPLMLQGRMVQRGHLLFARDDDFRVGYETLTLKKYLDYLPTAEFFQKHYFEYRRAELHTSEDSDTYG